MKLTRLLMCFVVALGLTLPSVNAYGKTWKDGKGGSLGTAAVGGTFFALGGPWANIIANNIPNYQLSVEVTGGSVQNVKMLENGELTFGMVSAPIVENGVLGTGWAKGKKYTKIRSLIPMYPAYLTVWVLNKSGIKNFKDLNGKILAPGPRGGAADNIFRYMADFWGIKCKFVNPGYSDMPGLMVDGMLTAGGSAGGEPFSSIQETDITEPVYILNFDMDKMKAMAAARSIFKVTMRPGGNYKLYPKSTPTLSFMDAMYTSSALSDELAYAMVKCWFENIKEFENAYPPAAKTQPGDIIYCAAPIHPGAAKYYKERGVKIPDNMIAR